MMDAADFLNALIVVFGLVFLLAIGGIGYMLIQPNFEPLPDKVQRHCVECHAKHDL